MHLAKLLAGGGNLMLLDEPTNDLDVDTLRALEEALVGWSGSALVTSHDRWFLDRMATHPGLRGRQRGPLVRGQLRRVRGAPAPRAGRRGRAAQADHLPEAHDAHLTGGGAPRSADAGLPRRPWDRARRARGSRRDHPRAPPHPADRPPRRRLPGRRHGPAAADVPAPAPKPTAADLAIAKSADKGSYEPGETIAYTIMVTNSGRTPVPRADVVVSDPQLADLAPDDGGTDGGLLGPGDSVTYAGTRVASVEDCGPLPTPPRSRCAAARGACATASRPTTAPPTGSTWRERRARPRSRTAC